MCFNSFYMSLNSLKRASDIEISSQLTGNVKIDTPQKVNFINKAIVVSLFFGLGVVGYFVSI